MIKKLAATGILGFAVTGAILSAAPANADIGTSGAAGVLSGNQAVAPASVPLSVCGNAVAVVGQTGAGCQGGGAAAAQSIR
ncbi:chaplin family protein [Actinomadura fibrosa]|uniref:Chaplin family protein n=1 Tax=Actinomadura fibrosa TaxID=111802 RepID=A0ABW2XNJ4_9ACTN|nr:chaplin family protein [Actinomadura fibrosa]